LQYLKEIDRYQPLDITPKYMVPLIRHVSESIGYTKPPAWRTLSQDYRKWLNAGRDIRALIFRYADRGLRGTRMLPEVTDTHDVIEQLYMTAERKRVPEVHLELSAVLPMRINFGGVIRFRCRAEVLSTAKLRGNPLMR
jgi:hypothetical protein